MRQYFRFVLLIGLLSLPLVTSTALPKAAALTPPAQQTPEPVEHMLGLGDEDTGTFERWERRRYGLDIETAGEPVDVVLFSTDNGVLVFYDGQGDPIQTVERMVGSGFEVFTWEPGDSIPTQLEVRFLGGPGEYSLSILPTEHHISEAPRPGEQVRRWAEFEVGEASETQTVTLPYLLYVPEDYDEMQPYPFFLFMHGSDETGTRLDFLKTQGIPKLIEDGEDYPFIIVSPQLFYGEVWAQQVDTLASFVTHLQAEFPIDPDRIYVTGLSLGGAGTWHFALAYPDLPAAVVPVAGFYRYGSRYVPENICDLAEMPIRVYHSEQDEIVELAWTQALVEALRVCGGEVQFTIYPAADHVQTFEQGYADSALYLWLLEQHK